MTERGLIVKALSGYYYVRPDEGDRPPLQCRARGIFKKDGITPLVGDRVQFEVTSNDEGWITEIAPRFSEFIRPPIANVNSAVLVFSLRNPNLNLALLDKMIVHAEKEHVDIAICFSKDDLFSQSEEDDRELCRLSELYEEIGYSVFRVSAQTGKGIDELKQHLQEKITMLSGPSGVGKSSILNAMLDDAQLETGSVSRKTGRGRHTTRHVELLSLKGGGYVADTPGFSQLDFSQIEMEQLSDYFVEFHRSGACKFRGCLHREEPDCAVIASLEQGRIHASRYEHYLLFLQEIQEMKRRY